MSQDARTAMTRREMLRLFGAVGAAAVAAACAQPAAPSPTAAPAKPTSAPAAAPPAPAAPTAAPVAKAAAVPGAVSDAEWEKLVAAAKQEGKLSVATYAGTGYRAAVEAFQEAFPGIQVEHSQFQSSSRDFVPRLLPEMKAGLYTWDVATMPAQEQLRQVKPAGGIDPIRPKIVRADVLDDKAWIGGFEAGFTDTDKKWGYQSVIIKFPTLYINTDVVKDGEIKTAKDLLDPKWKGKIIGGDPRSKGSGFVPATVMRLTYGDDILKQLYKDQEVVLSTDARQLTEFMVRGRYVLGIGAVDKVILQDFVAEGLGKNLKSLDLPDMDFVSSANNHLWLLTKAQHPNAAQVFINWLLTKDGQEVFSKAARVNSRRTDVAPVDESLLPTPGVKYMSGDFEDFIPEQQTTQDLAKALLD